MSYGLRILDNTGALCFDTNARLMRFHSSISTTVNALQTKTIPVTGIAVDGTWGIAAISLTMIKCTIQSGQIQIESNREATSSSVLITIFRC